METSEYGSWETKEALISEQLQNLSPALATWLILIKQQVQCPYLFESFHPANGAGTL